MKYLPEKLQKLDILGHAAYSLGSEGEPILFVAGPPGSAIMWGNVQRRLAPRSTVAVEFPLMTNGSFEEITDRLREIVSEVGAVVVVSHGEAVPFVLSIEASCVQLQVLTNGRLLGGLEAAQVSNLPKTIINSVTKLGIGPRFFSSSLGLRRAVKNPYVMDKAVVDSMIAPYFSTKEQRKGMLALFRLTSEERTLRTKVPVHVIWGDSDRMHPKKALEAWASNFMDVTIEYVPGGRWFYPVECPWELADRLVNIVKDRSI
jgi:pimeloyl-ACP methyl ester carboxylesterase